MQDNYDLRGQKQKAADFSLLMSRLETKILTGKDGDKCRRILRSKSLWLKLPPEKQVKWARFAQMTGEMDLALQVLAHVNNAYPQLADAWAHRIELLAMLGKYGKAAQVFALCRPFLDEVQRGALVKVLGDSQAPQAQSLEVPTSPFEMIRHMEKLVNNFLELFSGREDCFARQWVNKEEGKQGYVPVRRPLQAPDVEEHLAGNKTYGIYLMRSDSTVKTAVLDVDLLMHLRKGRANREELVVIKRERLYLIRRIRELAKQSGLFPLTEFSGGKGYHFWFFFNAPVPARRIRPVLEIISRVLNKDLSCFRIEVFPKQDTLSGKGFGNLVKLPLGIHRLTGKGSYFIECRDRSVNSQLEFLLKAQRSGSEETRIPPELQSKGRVFVHPRAREWANKFPELGMLESLCPPLGQIIASCRQGNTLSMKEEKVLFQTIGFLPRAKSLLHDLLSGQSEYNPHIVDYKLSRLRGSPIGCRRIHSLLNFTGDLCAFKAKGDYAHPLLHLDHWDESLVERSEKVRDLTSALENLKAAIAQAEAFLK